MGVLEDLDQLDFCQFCQKEVKVVNELAKDLPSNSAEFTSFASFTSEKVDSISENIVPFDHRGKGAGRAREIYIRTGGKTGKTGKKMITIRNH